MLMRAELARIANQADDQGFRIAVEVEPKSTTDRRTGDGRSERHPGCSQRLDAHAREPLAKT